MKRSSVLLLLGLVVLASSLALVLDGNLRQHLAAIGRYAFACVVVLGPLIAVGAFVGRIAEGASVRTE